MNTRRNIIWIVAGLALALLVYLSFLVPASLKLRWMDPVTGSIKCQTRWMVGWASRPRIEISALDHWMRSHGQTVEYNWSHSIEGTRKNLWGQPLGYGHGSAPAIYSLASCGHGEAMDAYIASATEAEINQFITTMKTGTEAEKRATADRAFDQGLAYDAKR